MSSLLEQAIVDAKALKEAAMKNAEATIIDKYSEEVKSTLNQLLEQDELTDALGLGAGEETPSAGAEAAIDEEVEADEIAEGVPDALRPRWHPRAHRAGGHGALHCPGAGAGDL